MSERQRETAPAPVDAGAAEANEAGRRKLKGLDDEKTAPKPRTRATKE